MVDRLIWFSTHCLSVGMSMFQAILLLNVRVTWLSQAEQLHWYGKTAFWSLVVMMCLCWFDVSKQLRNCLHSKWLGALSLVLPFSWFGRYLILAGSDRKLMQTDPKAACVRILRHAGSGNEDMFQIGKTKVACLVDALHFIILCLLRHELCAVVDLGHPSSVKFVQDQLHGLWAKY